MDTIGTVTRIRGKILKHPLLENPLNHLERAVLTSIVCGSTRNNHSLWKAKLVPSEVCAMCQDKSDTNAHMWDCANPEIVSIRAPYEKAIKQIIDKAPIP